MTKKNKEVNVIFREGGSVKWLGDDGWCIDSSKTSREMVLQYRELTATCFINKDKRFIVSEKDYDEFKFLIETHSIPENLLVEGHGNKPF